MSLNTEMLSGCKEVIYNQSKLPESVKEPIHLATKVIISLENSYEDFLSRELCGEMTRANPIVSMIELHGGDPTALLKWLSGYETAEVGTRSAWGS